MEQYEVLQRIGKGAFGSALLVRHKEEKKRFVLKKIRLARQTDRRRLSARQEMELISKVQHPYIVEYKDSWVEKGCFVCIVMGYCEGGDMAEAIKKANGTLFSEEKLCKWLVQLLMALNYLHSNRILHRDVKCSNIFLTKDHSIRLGDFGLAKVLKSDDLASSVVGTPSYMCPELLADMPYGSNSDIWSLGCCIYEMAALRPAFKAFDMHVLINKINKSVVAPLPSKFSSAFRRLIKTMLRRNPEHRPSAADLLKHSHLQPYVLQVHLKSVQPCKSLHIQQPARDHIRKIRFPAYEDDLICNKEMKKSFGNERAIKLNQPAAELCPVSSTLDITDRYLDQNRKTLSIGSDEALEIGVDKANCGNPSGATNIPIYTPARSSVPPLRRSEPSKIMTTRPNGKITQPSRMQLCGSFRQTRRAYLALPAFETPPRHNQSILHHMESPDVSVNAPCIDRIAKFALTSSEDPLFSIRKISSAQGSPSDAPCYGDHSDTKDKSTITSDGLGQRSSDLHRRFDTSSYQQRVEALETLLEFSARLLQQEKYQELGMILKPFGPEKASSRETAIWLTKSFREKSL